METENCLDVIGGVIEMHRDIVRSFHNEKKMRDVMAKLERFNSEILLENNQLKNSPVNSNNQMKIATDLISKLEGDVANHKRTIMELAHELNMHKKLNSIEVEIGAK